MQGQDRTPEQLVEEIEALRQRIAELEAAADHRQDQKEQKLFLRDQALLSEAAIELMNFPLDGNIYQFIGEQLKDLSDGRLVVVTTFDAELGQVCVQAVVGWNKYSRTILDILGQNPVGMTLSLNAEARKGLFTNDLERVSSGLYGTAFGEIPRPVCRALERALNLGAVYGMGFVREGNLLGSAVLFLNRETELRNPQAVKTFMGLAAVALQRRQSEKALLASEERLREAERVAHLGHYEIDVASGEAVWSDETFRIFGMSPESEAPNVETYRDMIYEEDRTKVYDHFNSCVQERGTFDLVYRIVTVDGDIRYVHSLGQAVEDPRTGEVKVFGTFQDVTEREQARLALQASEQRYRSLYEDLPIAIFETDYSEVKAYLDALRASGIEDFEAYLEEHPEVVERCAGLVEVVDVNRAAMRLYEVESKDSLQSDLDAILEAEAYDGFLRELIGIANGETRVEIECMTHTLAGTRRDIILTWQVARGHEETLSRCLVSIRDITERRRAEETLQHRNRELALLHHASQAFSSSLDLDQVLATVLEEARRLLDVVACSVWLIDPATDELVCWQATGPQREVVRNWRLPPGVGVAGQVVRYEESFLIPDTRTDERYFAGVDEETGLEIRSVLAVPLRVKNVVIGVLELVDVDVGRFTLSDMLLGERLAAPAAIAIENAQLYERARREIVERKRAAEALRESEEHYRDLFEGSPISLWEEDFSAVKRYLDELQASGVEDMRTYLEDHPECVAHCATLVDVIEVNQATLDLFEADSQADLFEGLGTIFVEETYAAFKEELVAIAERTTRLQIEAINQTLTGDKVYLVMNWRVAPGYERSFSKVLVSLIDVTERKQAEEALRAHAAQLEALRDVGLEITSQLDLDEVLQSIVAWAVFLAGGSAGGLSIYRPEQDVLDFAINTGLDALPDNVKVERGEGICGKVLDSGETIIVDDYQAWEGQSDNWADYLGNRADIGVPIRWGDEFLGVLEVMRDSSRGFSQDDADLLDLFAAQAAIAIHNAQLYERAQQEIAERKEVEEALARSNTELDQYAYVISHDLQEPLRTVTNWLHLLEKRYRGEMDEKADKYIDHAVDGAERMQEMINALLELSRVGTRGEAPAPTDVEAVIERTLKVLKRAIEETEAEVTHDPLPTVMADEAQLAQVFQNLIANAIKFRREGVPPRVHISAEQRGDEWMFSVADNGIGIDPDQAERIFQIFQRLHTREEYEGTGIGLALCKRIVERHGGRIWVESEPGTGSTFYFTLPTEKIVK
jgi:PAS domain S-box-containing protein